MGAAKVRHFTISTNFPTFVKTHRNPPAVVTTAIRKAAAFIEYAHTLHFVNYLQIVSKDYRGVLENCPNPLQG